MALVKPLLCYLFIGLDGHGWDGALDEVHLRGAGPAKVCYEKSPAQALFLFLSESFLRSVVSLLGDKSHRHNILTLLKN